MSNLSVDELLAQATCAVLIEGEVAGTAWLVSQEGHLLTAGHVLCKDREACYEAYDEVEVQFSDEASRGAARIEWGFDEEKGIDFAVLKLTDMPMGRQPLPISLAKSVKLNSKLKLRGYGKTFGDPITGQGEFKAAVDRQGVHRLFRYYSQELAEEGFSGGAVYSEQLGAVVAIQIEAVRKRFGPMSGMVLAMPLDRIAALWPPLKTLAVQNQRPSQLMTPTGIPKPPQPYFAHPYPQQANFTGRVVEREMISDWLTKDQRPVLALVAIGGMGKSSLCWHWLQVDVNHSQLSGIFWWSFYESEASFSRFLTEAIVYVSAGEVDPTTLTSNYDKVRMLVTLLQQQRILLVLDGFERLLRAYASMSAAYQRDETTSDTADVRACVDPNVARLLRHLVAGPTQAKVLITTRLMVHDLEDSIGFPLAGCRKEELNALHPDDAVTFMQVQGVTKGTAAEIKTACEAVGSHPLSLRLLSGLIARHRQQPGDIAAAPRHDIQANLVARRHHVLEAAVNALPEELQLLLSRMAAFRNPISADALAIFNEFGANVSAKSNQESETKWLPIWARIKSIFRPPPSRLESGTESKSSQQLDKAYPSERGDEEKFQAALEELVVRGLVFWDEQGRFYDLHPIVRAYAYDRLNNPVETHKRLRDYFAAIPTPHDSHIQSVDDLAVVTELYYHTVRAGYPDEAWRLYDSRLRTPLYYHLGAYKDDIQLLSELQGPESLVPRLQDIQAQTWGLLYLSMDYERTGQLQQSLECAQQAADLNRHDGAVTDLGSSLTALASVNRNLGQLRFASENSLSSIKIFDQVGGS